MNEEVIRSLCTSADVRHPGMTRNFFVAKVQYALGLGATVYRGPSPRIALIPSSEGKGVYTLNKTWCSCPGHLYSGRCWHRAFYIFMMDVLETEPVERSNEATGALYRQSA